MKTRKSNTRAVSPMISTTMIFALVIFVIALITLTGLPLIEKFQDQIKFEQAKNDLEKLNIVIKNVLLAENSKQEIQFNLSEMQLDVNKDSEKIEISYELKEASFNENNYEKKLNEMYWKRNGETMKLGLDYSNSFINLNSNLTMMNGVMQILITNHGMDENSTQVSITKK